MTEQIVDHRAFYELLRESEDCGRFSALRGVWLEEMKSRPWYPEVENRLDESIFLEYLISMDPRLYEFLEINDVNGSLIAPPELENLDMPVLAIYGSEDAFVDAHLGSAAYREIPRLNGNPDLTVVVFEGADHAILQLDSDGYLEIAPGYLTTMGDWLSEGR